MKEEIKNEMDGLLRRLSQRKGTTPLDGNTGSPSEHLDADELNAYAERALPEKTRLRYTEHLAECSRCRSLVTQLAQSTGAERIQTEKTQASWLASVFRKFLSPFSWRLALPVLAAIGIMAIGLIVLRRESSEKLIANRTAETAAEKPKANSESHDSNNNVQPQSLNESVATRGVEPRVAEQTAQNKTASDALARDRDKLALSTSPKDEPAGPGATSAAAAPPPPAPSEVEVAQADDAERQQKLEDLKKAKQAEEDQDKAANAKEPAAPAKTTRRVDELKPATVVAGSSPATGAQQMTPGLMASERGRREGKEDGSKNESETKTIAGRHFQKRGNIWMDTGYNSSMPTLTVSRGSESYRALVADEPGIRAIADQLDGDIVVVWKGKAYRIR